MPNNPFKKVKTAHERALEPKSLAPNPLEQEGKPALIIAVPALALLIGALFLAQMYHMSGDTFMLMVGSCMGGWFALLIGYFSYMTQKAVQYFHFDRIFGFTPRLRPRYEIYCDPKDIRILIEPGDKIHDWAKLEEALKKTEFDEEIRTKMLAKLKQLTSTEAKWYLIYFKHLHEYEGWDADRHEIPLFSSHVLFTNQPFDKQFIFGQGQENWLGAVYYNHPHSEMDVMKVFGWTRDPFFGTPMPWGILLHSSLNFKEEKLSDEQIELNEGWAWVTAVQHGIIDGQWKAIKQLEKVNESQIGEGYNAMEIAGKKTDMDQSLYTLIFEPRGKHFWQQGWFKVITFAILIMGVVLLVGELTGWLKIW